MKYIFEVPVYCGRLKEWRVLNMNTGTVYSKGYETMEEAAGSIENGKTRNKCTVVGWSLSNICEALVTLKRIARLANFPASDGAFDLGERLLEIGDWCKRHWRRPSAELQKSQDNV